MMESTTCHITLSFSHIVWIQSLFSDSSLNCNQQIYFKNNFTQHIDLNLYPRINIWWLLYYHVYSLFNLVQVMWWTFHILLQINTLKRILTIMFVVGNACDCHTMSDPADFRTHTCLLNHCRTPSIVPYIALLNLMQLSWVMFTDLHLSSRTCTCPAKKVWESTVASIFPASTLTFLQVQHVLSIPLRWYVSKAKVTLIPEFVATGDMESV